MQRPSGECSLLVFVCVGVHIRLHYFGRCFSSCKLEVSGLFSYTGRYATILKMITAMGVDMVPETR